MPPWPSSGFFLNPIPQRPSGFETTSRPASTSYWRLITFPSNWAMLSPVLRGKGSNPRAESSSQKI